MRQRAAPAFRLPMSSHEARMTPDPAYTIGWIERWPYPPLKGYQVQDILSHVSRRAWDEYFERCRDEADVRRELGMLWYARKIDYLKAED